MEVILGCGAGLDVHKDSIEACVRRMSAGGKAEHEVRHWGTTTRDLVAMAEWLGAIGVTHVAMESTGVYWKPIFNIQESQFEILLANAHHLKHVPGRKTDIRDCQWIAQLLQHGLLKESFIPPQPHRELRDLTRRRMRSKIQQLEQALYGKLTERHRWMLKLLLDQLGTTEQFITRLDERIAELTRPQQLVLEKLDAIPGVDRRVAEVLMAEIGPDMTPFPSHAHLASWAGISPGNNESAGKKRSGKTTKGSRWLRQALVQAAWAASHKKDSYFHAYARNIMHRRGRKRGLVAVAHSLLTVIYHMLKEGTAYRDPGPQFLDRIRSTHLIRFHVRRLQNLGMQVAITPAA